MAIVSTRISIKVVPAATPLDVLATSLAPGEVADFPQGAMPTDISFPPREGSGNGSLMQWSVRFHRSAETFGFASKRNTGTEPTYLMLYNETTSLWSKEFSGLVGDLGHGYDGFCFDRNLNRPYWHRFGEQSVDEWSDGTWKTHTPSPNINDIDKGWSNRATGLEWAPNLFGPGNSGFINVLGGTVIAIKQSDWTAINIGETTAGGSHPVVHYDPIGDSIYCGGGNDSDDLYKVVNGTTPSLMPLGTTPQYLSATSIGNGVFSLGGKHYQITPDKYYVSTDASNWSEAHNSPFDKSTAKGNVIYCSCESEGVFWAIADGGYSQIWKPPV